MSVTKTQMQLLIWTESNTFVKWTSRAIFPTALTSPLAGLGGHGKLQTRTPTVCDGAGPYVRSVACDRTRRTDSVFLRTVEGRGLPAAQHITPEARLALGDEVDLAENGAPQQDVHPGVQDLVPSGQPHAHNHQGFVAR